MEAKFAAHKILVCGFGSIGQRHARLLTEAGAQIAVVSRSPVTGHTSFQTISAALAAFNPTGVLIASETSRHLTQLRECEAAGFTGKILIEKPVFGEVLETPIPPAFAARIQVGYNLRFHPMMQRLKILASQEQWITANIYVGQHLPAWRPGTNYLNSSSAKAGTGGGVLRDLSHELDFAQWLLGPCLELVAKVEHSGALQIETEDNVVLLAKHARCGSVVFGMNYLDQITQRYLTLIGANSTIRADLLTGELTLNKTVESFKIDRDYTYQKMHAAWLGADQAHGDTTALCTLAEALATVNVIAAANESERGKKWVKIN